jgi:PPE-repeat protein
MNFSVLPPEINSALMFSGAGSGPMLEAAAAWDGLAAELESAANSFSSVTSGLAAQAWQGPASQAMAAAAAPYAGWLSAAAAHASGASAQAQSVANAFESALAATVHPVAVAANRSDFVSLVMSNVFGQNAPAIAATESQYEQMWAQDLTTMVGYHGGASAAAAQLASPAQALQNLPTMAANAAANIGYGNIGNGNIGFLNTGFDNIGIGNVSPNNPNIPSGNFGFYNNGISNFGIGNTGSYNVGVGLTGTGLFGVGPLSVVAFPNFPNPPA